MATHPDQTINLIENLENKSNEVLSKFKYQKNTVYLHSDTSLMPQNRKTWSSWNYLSTEQTINKSSVTYWMNILQNLNTSLNIFVSLNPYKKPKKDLIHKILYYEHPVFNLETNKAQNELDIIQGKNNIYHTGAWTAYGFHEDGIKSAVKITKLLDVQIPWDTN